MGGAANEVVANPYILFLDEPTSGLDSFTALSVVQTLDTLARYDYSIVSALCAVAFSFHCLSSLRLLYLCPSTCKGLTGCSGLHHPPASSHHL